MISPKMISSKEISAYTDSYFTKAREAAATDPTNPFVVWQLFQKRNGIFCGIGLLTQILEPADEVWSLEEGAAISPYETAMLVLDRAQSFVEFETVQIGVLARCGRVASNVRRAVEAANGKPVLFFPARFDVPEAQFYDGYAAAVGGAAACSTEKQMEGFNLYRGTHAPAIGTMPHALIAICNGDTVRAALAFAKARPNEDIWVLVDFDNDSARTAVEALQAFTERGLRLAGVRLDTSERLVDEGYHQAVQRGELPTDPHPSGVRPGLVQHVRRALDAAGGRHVKIAVSGGFTSDKIREFESQHTPVDVYAVGEWFLSGAMAYTSDIVAHFENGELLPLAKGGRGFNPNPRLQLLKGQGKLSKFLSIVLPSRRAG
jgi:nicotinate phosphoribosyltransferase